MHGLKQRREQEDQAFQLSLPGFEGPVQVLAEKLTQHKLSYDDVPLVEITDQFLTYLAQSAHLDLEVAGDFVSATARLVAMKAAHLLAIPGTESDEEPAQTLIRSGRLTEYQMQAHVLKRREGVEVFPWEREPKIPTVVESRGNVLTLVRARQTVQERFSRAGLVRMLPGRFMKLERALERLRRSLMSRKPQSFRAIAKGAPRNDAVVLFMALLELVRRREVTASQRSLFGDIALKARGSGRNQQARAS